MPLRVQKHVFWLQVSVDDTVLVEAFERQQDLGGVELRPLLREPLLPAEMVEELAPIQKVDDKIQLLACLERVVKLDNEWV